MFLLQHAPIKLGPSEFQCPFCLKIMERRTAVVKHIRVHTGEKPFVCPYCPHVCTQKSNLMTHIRKYHFNSKSMI